MAECAMVLPFLAMMLYGITELGYKISQLAWLNSSLCQAVEVGTANNAPYGTLNVEQAFNQLYSIQNRSMSTNTGPSLSSAYQTSDSTLMVAVSTEVRKVFGMLDPKLKAQCNAGYFPDSAAATGNFDTFLNESNVWWYDCDGVRNYEPPPDGEIVQAQPCADARAPADYISDDSVAGPGFGAAG